VYIIADGVDLLGSRILQGEFVAAECLIQSLENKPDVNWTNPKGYSAIHHAARMGNVGLMQLLQSEGADIFKAVKSGSTAVHIAAEQGHVGVLQFLKEAGCDLSAKRSDGVTAVWLAVKHNQLHVVKFLREAGCSMNPKLGQDPYSEAQLNETPVYIATLTGNLEALHILHDFGCDLEAKLKDGTSSVFVAAQEGHLEVLNFLLDQHCDFYSNLNPEGKTPQEIAEGNGHSLCVAALKVRARMPCI
jgi:ankyrin repeat protein